MNPLTSVSPTTDPSTVPSTDTPSTNRAEAAAPRGDAAGLHLFSYLLGLLTALLLVGGSLFLLRRPDPQPIVLHPPPTLAPTATPSPTATAAPITVFVSGAVRQPGLYKLSADARVGDAIEGAGGIEEDADGIAVNQAEKLWDGAQVHVPRLSSVGGVAAPQSSTNAVRSTEPPAGVSGSHGPIAPSPNGAGSAGVNINSASAAELEALPGIGPSKALAIIENRPYGLIEELERVPGIGTKTVEQLRELVVVQ